MKVFASVYLTKIKKNMIYFLQLHNSYYYLVKNENKKNYKIKMHSLRKREQFFYLTQKEKIEKKCIEKKTDFQQQKIE